MFMKRKQLVTAMPKLSSLLAEDLEIVGDVAFSGGLRVDGRVKGRVLGRATEALAPALLVLSERGRIEGGVHCGNAVIDGTIIGDLTVDECLNLQSNARIDGTIRYRELRMDIGAKVQGRMMRVEAPMPLPAADEAVDDGPLAVPSSL
jgi:cytoskeletal protein CcmA (bactofilin family)